MTGAGRFAPSPSGDLHIGNIRTGVLSWALARLSQRQWLWRIEDLDRVSAGAAAQQLADFEWLGLVPDHTPVVQSQRTTIYASYLATLTAAGLVYECYCSRKDIQQAASAPHAPPGSYPGTCRELTAPERERHRQRLHTQGRQPAIRLRTDARTVTIHDEILGPVSAPLDDFVLRRGDGVFAYNFAVVVDDGLTGVDQVVRADDLASSAPRQAFLTELLGFPPVQWWHVPLVVSPRGARLAKRDGAVTLQQLRAHGWTAAEVWAWLAASLGYSAWQSAADVIATLEPRQIRSEPTVFVPPR